MQPLVIVGTGLAGYNLAKEYRKLNAERPLILVTADDGRSYSKPMLSTGFTKGKEADGLAMAEASTMAAQLTAEVRTGVTVQAVDAKARRLALTDGSAIEYGELVLALGADPFRPPLAGNGLDRVFSVNDLGDYARFRQAVNQSKHILIIGGGLIGCEFANDLSNGGYAVTLVEPMGRLLPSLLPAAASAAVAEGLSGLGVRFCFGPGVSAVDKQGEGVCVTLGDGSQLDADRVLSAIGLRPRIGIAQQAGLATGRGIVVDRQLRTSDAHIYALGDCAEVEGLVLPYVLPLMACARALAKTLAGSPTEVQYPPMPVQIKTPVCPVVVAPVAPSTEGDWQIEANGLDVKAVFRNPQGQALGFALTGTFAGSAQEKSELTRLLPPLLP